MITPGLAQNALTEVEVVYYLATAVGGIEVRVLVISRIHVTSLLALFLIGVSYGNPDCQASEAFAKHIAASNAEPCDVRDLSLG